MIAQTGALLHRHGKALPIPDIALCLGVDLDAVDQALAALADRLQLCGMRIHHVATGIALVVDAAATHEDSQTLGEQTRRVSALNAGDFTLLLKLATCGAYTPSVMSSQTKRVNLNTLIKAGLAVEEEAAGISLTATARRCLGLP